MCGDDEKADVAWPLWLLAFERHSRGEARGSDLDTLGCARFQSDNECFGSAITSLRVVHEGVVGLFCDRLHGDRLAKKLCQWRA